MNLAASVAPTVWLQKAPAPQGCGGCVSSDDGPRCRTQVNGLPCAHPLLAGRRDRVQQVLEALDREVVDPDSGLGLVQRQWVKALRVTDDEAELTLAFASRCGAARSLSDAAFHTLRRLLPDTDVYVRHAA